MTISEFEIIDKFLKPIASNCRESLSLVDDIALFAGSSSYVVSKDIFTENVHFTMDENPRDIAKRLLVANISDIASAGSIPKYYLLGLPVNNRIDYEFYSDFCSGLSAINRRYNIDLVGGDTVKTNSDLFFSLTIIGESEGGVLKRSAAQDEDLIFIADKIGDPYLYLKSRFDNDFANVINPDEISKLRLSFYEKRVQVNFMNQLLRLGLSNCATDISDGLAADLMNICKASNISAQIDIGSEVFSDTANSLLDRGFIKLEELLTGGDDYVPIFTAKKNYKKAILSLAKTHDIDLNIIGRIVKGFPCGLYDKNGKKIKFKFNGYEH